MFLSSRKTALTTVLLLAALRLGVAPAAGTGQPRSDAADEKPAPGLTLGEFEELKPILDVKNQPWTTIPWKYSITEARKAAAATRKPIFMVVNTGNALGCT